MRTQNVRVVPYQDIWKKQFEEIREYVEVGLESYVREIHHVGSTSVEGLAAKPIIDIDIEVYDNVDIDKVTNILAQKGYICEGDLGIPDRIAYAYENTIFAEHHLYVCPSSSKELHRHLCFRNFLRMNKEARDEYGGVKLRAAEACHNDIDVYMDMKHEVIERLYIQMEFPEFDCISMKKIDKGYSWETKYIMETADSKKYVIRVAPMKYREKKQEEYCLLKKYAELQLPISLPVCLKELQYQDSIASVLSYVEGSDLEEILPSLSEEEQYRLGREAGMILHKIHSIALDDENQVEFKKKLIDKKTRQLQKYLDSTLRQSDDENILKYWHTHLDKIGNQMAYSHGDFHPGNLIYTPDHHIGVIDFNRSSKDDPYEEFYKLQMFVAEISIPYCVGEIDGYFGENVPEEFWKVNGFYVAHGILFSIVWAEPFGIDEVYKMIDRYQRAKKDYMDFQTDIPSWYTMNKGKWR